MSFSQFLSQLHENGRVTVSILPDHSPAAFDQLDASIRELDAAARLDLAHEAPPLNPESAAWAALLLYQACQFLTYREIGPDVVKQTLAQLCPERPSPSVCYSVDLTFRYLPDLIALARGIAEGDPLVDGLLVLAAAWPLSSVGVKNLTTLDLAPFITYPSLRRLYADRIIDRRDQSRLADPQAAEAVRESLGAFPDLAPGLSFP